MAKQDDGLFLLEVLIDKIIFKKSPCFSDKDFRTCVNIECAAVEPLEICDDDPGVCIAKSGGPFVKTFNTGKSCLFSLKEADISKAMSTFPVKVSVIKSLPCGCLPTKIIMGEATIDMTKEFVQARKKYLEDPNNVSYQALKDSFRIVAPDGAEAGEIIMFLRISCFGKLIITRFQGSGGPPTLGTGGGGNAIVDRSCNPKREFQTTDDPCACGAARSGGAGGGAGGSGGGRSGSCPIARDPYNSMPCQDPDDPCFCSGPKPPGKQQMECRNTDQYCLHMPKGSLQSLPFNQNLTEKQKEDIINFCNHLENSSDGLISNPKPLKPLSQATVIVQQCLNIFIENMTLPTLTDEMNSLVTECFSSSSLYTLRSKNRSSCTDTVNCMSQANSQCLFRKDSESYAFGKQETTVYMTLYDNNIQRHSSTQATASINKCLQVLSNCHDENYRCCNEHSRIISNYSSTFSLPQNLNKNSIDNNNPFSDIYYIGRKQLQPTSGMENSASLSRSRQHIYANITAAAVKNEKGKTKDTAAAPPKNQRGKSKDTSSSQAKSDCSTSCCQTNKSQGCSAGTSTGKAVSIKDDKDPTGQVSTKGDMSATISHIRIGPKEPCPVHGSSPCQGPKCIAATSDGGQAAPVKVSTVTNPRRGVFELVVRRINGAPLAKNELMLEWTPPPSRPPPCGGPCVMPCPTPCRPSKCKMIVCRPSKPKCCKKRCKKPCGPVPCCSATCKKCCKPSCCGKPCRPKRPCCLPPPKCRPCGSCKPCPPSICWPCPPSSCLPCPPTHCGPSPSKPCPPRPKCKPSCRRCKPSPCRSPCRPCPPSPCRPCSPPPRCRPCRPPRVCRTPRFCRGTPISPCKSCRKCSPCPPSPCRPCPPSPCRACPSPCVSCPPIPCALPCSHACCRSPCALPCSSSPCLRPCPVGRRKKPRKCKSQPRIKTHKKHVSPCWNRSKTCPVVRCQSVPAPPCFTCCVASCPPPKCCKLAPRYCKSSCSSGCG